MESTLFLYFLFHLLSEAFYYENNLSFDIVLIAKPKLRRDYIFMIHQEQLRFNKKIKFNFKGGDLTSDAGLLLIQEFMHHMKFPELLKQYFYLETDQAIRTHTNHDLCLQQIYQTIAGYHCADDADELRVDPLLTTLLDKPSLASQPTLSRFTHRLTKETSKQFELINQKLLSQFYQVETPHHFIFDVDSTHFQTYGHQYGKAFNAHYQAQGFHPLMVFDGMTGDCLKVELRAGNRVPILRSKFTPLMGIIYFKEYRFFSRSRTLSLSKESFLRAIESFAETVALLIRNCISCAKR